VTACPCAQHGWSPWRTIAGGLLERRCCCGSVERITPDALAAATLDRPLATLRALRQAIDKTRWSDE